MNSTDFEEVLVEPGSVVPLDIGMATQKTLSELTPVFFRPVNSTDGTLKTYFCADETRSSKALDVFKQVYGSTVPVLEDEKLGMRVLVDHSIVESFAQGGRTVITSRIYPTEAIYGAARLFLFNNATSVNVKATLKIWELNSAFIHPSVSYEFRLSYITASPLGVPQQVIAVNGKFPGPVINATTNYVVIVNVWNDLDDENLLMTCNREIIPIPFTQPDGDIILLIGDWYTQNHTALRTALDSGKDLGMPDGVLINGKGPYRYNTTFVPDGIEYETIQVDPGKTYRLRVHNVGTSTSLNFRIQGHNLLLVETEGHYTSQQNFTSFDIHVGQSYSFLATMDQNATSDYYIVASAREVHCDSIKVNVVVFTWVRQNTTASGARPNPQGSFHYGQINITETYILRILPPVTIDGKQRATLNGISFVNPDTPIRLADLHNVKGAYKLDFPDKPLDRPPRMDISVINATYKGFIQVVLQNNDTKMLSFHMDGYSFFVVGMDWGVWTEDKKSSYNNWDAISRCTVEVYPGDGQQSWSLWTMLEYGILE
ncbi:hypothetical protein GH714_040300 [Hevea brasiliensis]|uniref:Uncharacterized protein n=1 Tax=Hevea brasiliensis TaxID=3981 RepID=A0A6A6MU94_HEVBR|nr:hypothetical protein GH714_040300 [Hevea brasiliensis]